MSKEVTLYGQDLVSEIENYVKPYFAIAVTDDASMTQAKEVGKLILGYKKRVEARRVELKAPLLEQTKVIDSAAKDVSLPLTKLEDHLKAELLKYSKQLEELRVQALRKQREEEQRRLQAEQEERERLKREQEAAQAEELAQMEAAARAMGLDPEEEKRKILAQQKAELELEQSKLDREHLKVSVEAEQERKELAQMRVKGARKVWTYRVVDEAAVERRFLSIDDKKIREEIKLGARGSHLKGIEIYQEERMDLGR